MLIIDQLAEARVSRVLPRESGKQPPADDVLRVQADLAAHADELIPTGVDFGRDDAYDCFYANKPVVVGDLQSRFKRRWGPHGFLQRFGAESVQEMWSDIGNSFNPGVVRGTAMSLAEMTPRKSAMVVEYFISKVKVFLINVKKYL